MTTTLSNGNSVAAKTNDGGFTVTTIHNGVTTTQQLSQDDIKKIGNLTVAADESGHLIVEQQQDSETTKVTASSTGEVAYEKTVVTKNNAGDQTSVSSDAEGTVTKVVLDTTNGSKTTAVVNGNGGVDVTHKDPSGKVTTKVVDKNADGTLDLCQGAILNIDNKGQQPELSVDVNNTPEPTTPVQPENDKESTVDSKSSVGTPQGTSDSAEKSSLESSTDQLPAMGDKADGKISLMGMVALALTALFAGANKRKGDKDRD